jgi:transposase
VRKNRVWARLLGLERAVVESVEIDDEGQVVVAVRPRHRERDRCGVCGRRCAGFDLGEGRRRWRALDLGTTTTIAHLEADAPRVRCAEHGVVVCAVPWARHGSRFTLAFEQQVAWLAVNTSASAVAELMRISWRSVGRICERVAREAGRKGDLLAGLSRIGIDEISHRKGQRYLTVVVDQRHRAAGLGGAGARQEDRRGVLRRARRRARRAPGARLLRHGGLDRGGARRALPQGQALRRSLPRRQVGHRRARRDPPRGLERGPPGGPGRHGPRAQRAPAMRCGATPRT